jgi:hypothetical protein
MKSFYWFCIRKLYWYASTVLYKIGTPIVNLGAKYFVISMELYLKERGIDPTIDTTKETK